MPSIWHGHKKNTLMGSRIRRCLWLRALGLQPLLQCGKLVLQSPDFLVCHGALFLVQSEFFLDVFDFLLDFFRLHLLLPLDIEDIAAGIDDSVCATLVLQLHVDIFTTLCAQVASIHDPLLCRHLIAEGEIVRDHDYTTCPRLMASVRAPKSIAIEVIRGFVDDEDVRVLPHGGPKHNLDLLPCGQRAQVVVCGELCGDAIIGEMFLHSWSGQLLVLEPRHRCLLLVLALHLYLETHLDEQSPADPSQEIDRIPLPFDLVLMLHLAFASGRNGIQHNSLLQALLLVLYFALVVVE